MNAPRTAEIERLRALVAAGNEASAREFTGKLVKRYPASPVVWNAFGALLAKDQQFEPARKALERAAALAPRDPVTHANLGGVLASLGQLAAAEVALREAIHLQPAHAEAHNGLAATLALRDRLPEALQHYRWATQLNPQLTKAWIGQGAVLTTLGQLGEAQRSLERALLLAPGLVEVHQRLGALHSARGDVDKAIACLRRCLELEPANADCRSNLLMTFQYAPDVKPEDAIEEALLFGVRTTAAVRPYTQWKCPPRAEPLRVGLVSGDLRAHPVGYFLEGMCAELNPARIQLFGYPTSHIEDALTQRLRGRCAAWSPIASLADADAAARIHEQAPHILVDLAGHTAFNRLPLFAWRPAPLQASWLGYVATTGMREIDYVIADPVTVPPEGEAHFVERVWRLPDTRLCFSKPAEPVEVSDLPALRNGHVTFGCFNTLSKLNDKVLKLWARVLDAVPGSRLRIIARQLSDEGVRDDLSRRFFHTGVDAARLDLGGSLPRDRYLAAYGDIDIALDPFPFTGGTTTAESLWMGVPVLTLAGARLVERQGAGLLTVVGLDDWIAENGDDYVRRATAFAADLARVRELRATLRQRVLASSLGDTRRFARHFSDALEAMWRAHCLSS